MCGTAQGRTGRMQLMLGVTWTQACLGQPSPRLLEHLVPKPESFPGPIIPGHLFCVLFSQTLGI